MSLNLPAPIGAYYAASNAHDIDAMLAPFAADAHVRDEGQDHVGHVAIRAWMEHTTRKYKATATPEGVTEVNGVIVVRALVAGDFPGSPAHLTYRFTLANAQISHLEIG